MDDGVTVHERICQWEKTVSDTHIYASSLLNDSPTSADILSAPMMDQKQLETIAKAHRKAELHNLQLSQQNKEQQQVISDLKRRLVTLSSPPHRKEVGELCEQSPNSSLCVFELETKSRELEIHTEYLQHENEDFQTTVHKLRQEHVEGFEEAASTHKSLKEQLTTLRMEKEEIRMKSNTRIQALKEELEAKTNHQKAVQLELERAREDAVNAHTTLVDLRAREEKDMAYIQQLETQLVMVDTEGKTLLNDLVKNKADLEERLTEKDQCFRDVTLQCKSLAAQVKSLQRQNAELEDKAQQCDKESSSTAFHDATALSLANKEIEKFQAYIKRLKDELCDKTAELHTTCEYNAVLETKVKDLQLDLQLKEQDDGGCEQSICKINEMHQELEDKIKSIQGLEVQIHDLIHNNNLLSDTVKATEQKYEDLLTESEFSTNEARTEVTTLQALCLQLQLEKAEFQQKLITADAKGHELTAVEVSLQRQLERSTMELQQVKQEFHDYQTHIAAIHSDQEQHDSCLSNPRVREQFKEQLKQINEQVGTLEHTITQATYYEDGVISKSEHESCVKLLMAMLHHSSAQSAEFLNRSNVTQLELTRQFDTVKDNEETETVSLVYHNTEMEALKLQLQEQQEFQEVLLATMERRIKSLENSYMSEVGSPHKRCNNEASGDMTRQDYEHKLQFRLVALEREKRSLQMYLTRRSSLSQTAMDLDERVKCLEIDQQQLSQSTPAHTILCQLEDRIAVLEEKHTDLLTQVNKDSSNANSVAALSSTPTKNKAGEWTAIAKVYERLKSLEERLSTVMPVSPRTPRPTTQPQSPRLAETPKHQHIVATTVEPPTEDQSILDTSIDISAITTMNATHSQPLTTVTEGNNGVDVLSLLAENQKLQQELQHTQQRLKAQIPPRKKEKLPKWKQEWWEGHNKLEDEIKKLQEDKKRLEAEKRVILVAVERLTNERRKDRKEKEAIAAKSEAQFLHKLREEKDTTKSGTAPMLEALIKEKGVLSDRVNELEGIVTQNATRQSMYQQRNALLGELKNTQEQKIQCEADVAQRDNTIAELEREIESMKDANKDDKRRINHMLDEKRVQINLLETEVAELRKQMYDLQQTATPLAGLSISPALLGKKAGRATPQTHDEIFHTKMVVLQAQVQELRAKETDLAKRSKQLDVRYDNLTWLLNTRNGMWADLLFVYSQICDIVKTSKDVEQCCTDMKTGNKKAQSLKSLLWLTKSMNMGVDKAEDSMRKVVAMYTTKYEKNVLGIDTDRFQVHSKEPGILIGDDEVRIKPWYYDLPPGMLDATQVDGFGLLGGHVTFIPSFTSMDEADADKQKPTGLVAESLELLRPVVPIRSTGSAKQTFVAHEQSMMEANKNHHTKTTQQQQQQQQQRSSSPLTKRSNTPTIKHSSISSSASSTSLADSTSSKRSRTPVGRDSHGPVPSKTRIPKSPRGMDNRSDNSTPPVAPAPVAEKEHNNNSHTPTQPENNGPPCGTPNNNLANRVRFADAYITSAASEAAKDTSTNSKPNITNNSTTPTTKPSGAVGGGPNGKLGGGAMAGGGGGSGGGSCSKKEEREENSSCTKIGNKSENSATTKSGLSGTPTKCNTSKESSNSTNNRTNSPPPSVVRERLLASNRRAGSPMRGGRSSLGGKSENSALVMVRKEQSATQAGNSSSTYMPNTTTRSISPNVHKHINVSTCGGRSSVVSVASSSSSTTSSSRTRRQNSKSPLRRSNDDLEVHSSNVRSRSRSPLSDRAKVLDAAVALAGSSFNATHPIAPV